MSADVRPVIAIQTSDDGRVHLVMGDPGVVVAVYRASAPDTEWAPERVFTVTIGGGQALSAVGYLEKVVPASGLARDVVEAIKRSGGEVPDLLDGDLFACLETDARSTDQGEKHEHEDAAFDDDAALVNRMRERFGIRTDASLARALGIQASHLGDVRRRRRALPMMTKLRVLEHLGHDFAGRALASLVGKSKSEALMAVDLRRLAAEASRDTRARVACGQARDDGSARSKDGPC